MRVLSVPMLAPFLGQRAAPVDASRAGARMDVVQAADAIAERRALTGGRREQRR